MSQNGLQRVQRNRQRNPNRHRTGTGKGAAQHNRWEHVGAWEASLQVGQQDAEARNHDGSADRKTDQQKGPSGVLDGNGRGPAEMEQCTRL
jgi:hypothetical protein